MDRNKLILLIVLVLIVAAYIFFVVWGATSDDNRGGGGKGPTTADNYSPYPITQKAGNFMGDWLGRFIPKPNIACDSPAPNGAELVCQSLAIDKDIKVPGKNGASFRIATLVVLKGRAHIEYDDNTDAAGKADMDEQDFDLPDTKHGNSNKGTIIVFESGGNLRISCRDNSACTVGLK